MINTNYSYNINYTKYQKTNNKISYNYPKKTQNINSSNINFGGNILSKIFTRLSNPKNEKEAIRRLINKDSGYFIKGKDEYLPILKKDFANTTYNFDEVIIKEPLVKTSIEGMANNTEKYEYREGISPSWIKKGLMKKLSRIVFITGNKNKSPIIQILQLPKNEFANKIALTKVQNIEHDMMEHENNQKYMIPEIRSKFLFYGAKNAIKELNINEIQLEEFRLNKECKFSY